MLYYNNVENAEILKNIIVDFDIPEQWKIFDCVFTFSVCYHQSTKEYNKFDYNIVESYNLGLLNVNNGVYSEIIIKREEGEPRLCAKELLTIIVDFLKSSGNLKYNTKKCLHFLQICRKGDIEWSLLSDRDNVDLRITQGMPYYKYTSLHHYTNIFKVNKCINVPWSRGHGISVSLTNINVVHTNSPLFHFNKLVEIVLGRINRNICTNLYLSIFRVLKIEVAQLNSAPGEPRFLEKFVENHRDYRRCEPRFEHNYVIHIITSKYKAKSLCCHKPLAVRIIPRLLRDLRQGI